MRPGRRVDRLCPGAGRPSMSMPHSASTAASTAPQTIAESARLKIGQTCPSLLNRLIQSTTCPRPTPGARKTPIDQIADRSAEHQAQRDSPAGRAHPARGAQDEGDDR